MDKNHEKRLKWWKDAKFGLFIHWGLYALLARGEWAMAASKIPVDEYEKLGKQFNPIKFNAKEWVNIAKTAGVKYIVITAKHHDGFAMFHSNAEKFNIMDATPFKRDPIKELAEECQKQDIKLCLYYSHVIDWHHPHSVHEYYNNTWDFDLEKKAFYNYWNNLAKPQIRELLTNYGPIGLLWFDTAGGLSKKDSKEIIDIAHKLQPNCLINSRVSHWPNMGDYQSKGDNEIPMYGEDTRPWETPMTLNKSWGYRDKDQEWKTTESVIFKMANIVSKGGNLLLNVGPTAEGMIPDTSVERLTEVGTWLNINGEAIYESDPNPYPYEFEWGAITVKPRKVFLHLYHKYCPKGELVLFGLKNKVLKTYVLADELKGQLDINQVYNEESDHHALSIKLPEQLPDKYVSVVVLEVAGEVQVDQSFGQQASGMIKLDMVHATIDEKNTTANWEFKVVHPGTFDVVLVNFKKAGTDWDSEYKERVKIKLAEQQLECIPKEDITMEESQSCQYPYSEIHSKLGRVEVNRSGYLTLTLTSDKIHGKSETTEIWQANAVKLRSLILIPANSVQPDVTSEN
ncbi:alpha-L-fucosidase [Bacillus sp. FSL K6-3431]|uniref:alpha-L-fucosidase n=1 Tax=Bacillus sp. FSL K6-3431 TaxID=2921500 RepID=UPI0030F76493